MNNLGAAIKSIDNKRKFKLLMISIVSSLVMFSPRSVSAASYSASFTERAANPSAENQSFPGGTTISKLKLFNGKLYSGYGNYYSNTGPIDIVPYNIDTNQFESVVHTVPSESINNWKEINGKLYTTTVDPTCAGSCPAGYVVSSDGINWETKTPVNAEHMYDIATLTGTDLWMFGSSGGATATAWRSVDDGATWSVVRERVNEPGGDNAERFYWGSALSGKMYMQSNNHPYDNPFEVFDGSSWSTLAEEDVCGSGNWGGGPKAVVFHDKIVCSSLYSDISFFDGQNTEILDLSAYSYCTPDPNGTDIITTTDSILILCQAYGSSESAILRSTDLVNWDIITGLPFWATSIEVDEATDTIYAGTMDSKIFTAMMPSFNTSQPTTTTFPNAVDAKSITLTTPASTALTCNNSSTEDSLPTQDPSFQYPLGLVDFCLTVPSGTTQDITLTFESGLRPQDVVARKYNRVTKQYANVPGATITEDTIGGKHVLVLKYQVTDGGELDEDGVVNGEIIDPVGLAVNNSATVGGESEAAGNNLAAQSPISKKAASLAKTGDSAQTIIIAALSLLVLSGFVFLGLTKRNQLNSK